MLGLGLLCLFPGPLLVQLALIGEPQAWPWLVLSEGWDPLTVKHSGKLEHAELTGH